MKKQLKLFLGISILLILGMIVFLFFQNYKQSQTSFLALTVPVVKTDLQSKQLYEKVKNKAGIQSVEFRSQDQKVLVYFNHSILSDQDIILMLKQHGYRVELKKETKPLEVLDYNIQYNPTAR